jgi:hypothetical protein
MPEALKIVLFSMAAAIVYGILHDQVTAHLCVEYFTVAHPMIIPTRSPFLLALFWGVFATWWVGLFLGAALALAARLGPAPKIGLAALKRPIVILMILSGIAAFLAGAAGMVLVDHGLVAPSGWWPSAVPAERHAAFVADALAHLVSYAAGGLGGIVLIALTLWRRFTRKGGAGAAPA